MTDYETAMLRLEAWKAIEGWGRAGNPSATDVLGKLTKPFDWPARLVLAEELIAWMIKEAETAPR